LFFAERKQIEKLTYEAVEGWLGADFCSEMVKLFYRWGGKPVGCNFGV
jgi:hypothetical protein